MNIGIDFDDVLFAFNEGLAEWHNKNYGTSYRMPDILNYPLENVWKCTREEAIRRVHEFYDSPEHMELAPIEGAVESVERLRRERHSLIIATSRPSRVRSITEALLREHFQYRAFRDIFFLGDYAGAVVAMTKADLCRAFEIDIFIDDHIGHAYAIEKEGVPVLLHDRPWNQDELPSLVTRVHSWDEIIGHIL